MVGGAGVNVPELTGAMCLRSSRYLLKVPELKEQLSLRGLSTTGIRVELAARLELALADEAATPPWPRSSMTLAKERRCVLRSASNKNADATSASSKRGCKVQVPALSCTTLLAGLPQLATEPAGARQLQAAMARLPSHKVCVALAPHLVRLSQHPHGGRVAAAAVAACPAEDATSLALYSTALQGHELELSKHRYGHALMLAALSALPPRLVATHATAFAGYVAECARHSQGAGACIEALFARSSGDGAATVLAELAAALPSLALSHSGSNVLCSALSVAGAKGRHSGDARFLLLMFC